MAGRIVKRGQLKELMRQNKVMRQLLEEWPAREIMMDYEKSWNERRQSLLQSSPLVEIDLGQGEA
ncbi:MAG: hypothetical protein K1X75_07965 [Leptospirales bacterium]|nr:hypothetical protein [Leptospirales bacterium]